MLRFALQPRLSRSGMTLTELSRRTGIPQPSLSRYANGRCDITLRQLGRIAAALKVPPAALLQDRSPTRDLRREIANRGRRGAREDKSWVSRLHHSLCRHYRRVRPA